MTLQRPAFRSVSLLRAAVLLPAAPYGIHQWRGKRERERERERERRNWNAESRNIEIEANVHCQPTAA
jgi:hypothetical protein